ncbi:DNA-3-methyladenine glycosylase I [Magnetospirillum gryphiswaldense]|uniref:Methyladenine glycosylase n=1 Tax=Magnetospirillum gryphiswaldense TaxID=55518 RepID=A4U1F3_9PROT|nr:DNA-3-methyladenine glycosylase I [Magnetospirillum gryphiswaldense]AVM73655.1 DNA-3-methyladenine glycosylase 1 [Magnetospirillum gryphiswaldense MSR-1]AVM77558.1 DNA-3-methyladenine glycosylase 1 [Magnetospirillum gryphiswaldense]CAM76710.1 Methyladenine glycosylase [Magnetospirillum gryphiswaldense MSR-1]
MSGYCQSAPGHPIHGPYHDREYGFPVADDRVLFERLCLEVFQAGLSWLIVLKKRPTLNLAFDGFDPARIAGYDDGDVARLLADDSIIRNRRKIAATIENAKRLKALQVDHGSFSHWLAAHHPRDKADWVKLFRQTFVFMGGEVVGEFLMSIGYLPGAHHPDCPVFAELTKIQPPWMKA